MAHNLSPLRVSQSYHGREPNQNVVVEVSQLVKEEDEQSLDLTPGVESSPLVRNDDADEVVEVSPLVTEEDEQSVDLSNHDEVTNFRKLVMQQKWDGVIERYQTSIFYHDIRIVGNGTALHIAVNANKKEVATRLVNEILKSGNEKCLRIMNEEGATPLHLAAVKGLADICEHIIGKMGERNYLIKEKNPAGETPLFWAVSEYKTLVFVYLQQFYPGNLSNAMDNNHTTILHIAIQREMFDLAILIMIFYECIIGTKDKDGKTPLEILATRQSAFRSGTWLPWWKEILYYCVPTGNNHATTILGQSSQDLVKKNEKNDILQVQELEKRYNIKPQNSLFKWRAQSLVDKVATIKRNEQYGPRLLQYFMRNPKWYMDCGNGPEDGKFEDPNFLEYTKNQRKGGDTSTHETNKNKKLEDSENIDGKDTTILAVVKNGIAEIMEWLNSQIPITSDKKGLLLVATNNLNKEGKHVVKNTAYLIAASNGITEIMKELESKMPSVIDETNSNNENALLLAVKNMQPQVIEHLLTTLPEGVFFNLAVQFDKNGNTMLHLAASASSFESDVTWTVCGVAQRMMWDVKWYKYIKGLAQPIFINRSNKDGETPSEIFKENHKEHLEKSVKLMKETADSCSVVAALIAGVSFATSGSVPGGNQQSGEPTFEGHPAFEGFVISSLIGLYFSVTALIMFLTILTSRKEVDDFSLNLPIKLLLGLSSLLVSIISMFVSFCSGHFFVLTEKYTMRGILFYLYISICLPVTFYAIVQLPIIVDLLKVIFKRAPSRSIKSVLI